MKKLLIGLVIVAAAGTGTAIYLSKRKKSQAQTDPADSTSSQPTWKASQPEQPSSVTTVVNRNASAEDTVALVQKVAWEERNSTTVKALLSQLPFQPRLSWVEKMYWLIDSKFEYQYDADGKEQVKTPDRMARDGGGDCDDFSTLWKAILNSVDVACWLKIVSYEKGKVWEHIYPVVPVQDGSPIVIDNVAGKFRKTFNVEVEHVDVKIFKS
jgi:transglutaminase-like putative cysteine protease